MTDFPDHLERRCPRLGGPVTFGYCRVQAADGEVCAKILDCWWERFDVAGLMRQCLSEEAFRRLAEPRRPPNKVASLLDLIQKAQGRPKDSP